MEKVLLELEPSIINALLPSLLKGMLISVFVTGFLYGVAFLLKLVGLLNITLEISLFSILVPFVIIALFPFLWSLLMLKNTKYKFYDLHVTKEFRFFIVKKYSVLYSQITNVTLEINIWDRITRAGDVIIHTAENVKTDLSLRYMSDPEEVEHKIYRLINAGKHQSHHNHSGQRQNHQ